MRHNYHVRLENVPVVLLLLINNEFFAGFKTKANYFNRLFNEQCIVITTYCFTPSLTPSKIVVLTVI